MLLGSSGSNINKRDVQRKICCKQCRQVKFKGTMLTWPVQKQRLGTAQNTQNNT